MKNKILFPMVFGLILTACGTPASNGGKGQAKNALVNIDDFGTVKFEAEDFSTENWVSDDSYNGNVLISDSAASGGMYLAGAARTNSGTATFKFKLEKYSKVVFSAAYAQQAAWLDETIQLDKTYFYNIESVSPFTNADKILPKRNSASSWQLMAYEPQNLYPGTYNVTLSVVENAPKACPSIDYVTFETTDPNEDVPVDPSTITEVPDNDFHNLNQYKYIMDPDWKNFKIYADGSDLSDPDCIKLKFDDLVTDDKYYVQVVEGSDDFTDAVVHEVNEPMYKLWNAKLSTTYYYRAAEEEADLDCAEVRYITVSSNAPRVIRCDEVLNFRDIGGWDTYLVPGAKINQGLYYRCAQLNQSGVSSTKSQINADGIKAIEELGIKVDIDMRDSYNIPKTSPASTAEWPVELVNASIPSGTESTRWEKFEDVYKLIFETIAECDEKPALLHCTYGADRTGIASFFLEALLGMDLDDIRRDYVWTKFTQGRDPNPDGELAKWIQKTEDTYDDDNFANKMRSHLMTKGISFETLEHIREIFIPGYVAEEE